MLRRTVSALAATGLAAVALAAPASASGTRAADPSGTRSLAAVLTADGNRFDTNWYDYDIVTEAVLAVLAKKPDSPVAVLTDGTTPVTAFIPNDRAFQVLVKDLTGTWKSEQNTFAAVASLGIDTVEQVLLYHVVPGRVTAAQVTRLSSARTVQGANVRINASGGTVRINDATVTRADVRASNGIIHVIDTVLLPPN